MNIRFKNWNCEIVKHQYNNNGRTALELVAAEDDMEQDIWKGEPIATATVNLSDTPLASDEVIVKDYSENEGMLDTLLKAGVVELTGRTVSTGFVTCPVCVLCI